MTPCRNCKSGFSTDEGDYVYDSIKNEYIDIPNPCTCCFGNYEDCPNCVREFPNSVEAVQMGND